MGPTATRLLTATAYGVGVTLSLFYLMSQLISGGQDLKKSDDTENFIEFVRIKRDDIVQERKRELPKKAPEPKKPPPPAKLSTAAEAPSKPQMNMDLPKLSTSLKGNGPYLGPAGAGGGTGVTPIVRIEPQYPRKAAMQGIQGWVVLSFDITASGTVDNVQVLDAQPKRIFDMEAKRALLKWKYKPKMEDGKPVAQPGEKVRLDFKLE
ncbi:MAG: energy transducer TonB [Bdellovibrionales bacterium]|nr:energy transducer TonB [Bdellovibrionales bacterium]